MERYTVTVLPGGRITIPAAIRRDLDLHPGDALVWWEKGHEVHFRKADPGEIAPDTSHPIIGEASAPKADRTARKE